MPDAWYKYMFLQDWRSLFPLLPVVGEWVHYTPAAMKGKTPKGQLHSDDIWTPDRECSLRSLKSFPVVCVPPNNSCDRSPL